MTMNLKTYEELIELPTFEERFEYLKLDGRIGQDTFGFDRIYNQRFYTSKEWKRARNYVVARDGGFDLGIREDGHEICGLIMVHHMNPITMDDFRSGSPLLLDPRYLISVSRDTHTAITYRGAIPHIPKVIERSKYDTCPWRHIQKED